MVLKLIPVFIFFGLLSIVLQGDFFSWPALINLSLALMLIAYGFFRKIIQLSIKNSNSLKIAKNIFYLLLLFGALFFLNQVSRRFDFRLDLTENEVFSLSEESIEIAQRVKYPLKFIRLDDSNNSTRQEAQDLLSLFSKVNPLISLELLDPQTARQTYSYINSSEPNLTYVEYQAADIVRGRFNKFSEAEISTAIFKITSTKARVACYAVGHGEPDPDSASDDGLKKFTEFLKAQNIALVGLLLESVAKMPPECEFLMIMPAKQKYTAKEQELVREYLGSGAQLLLLHDPESADNFSWLTDSYGIKILNAVVLDKQQELQGAPEVGWQFIATHFEKNGITKNLKGSQTPLVFLLGSPLSITDDALAKAIVLSSKTSWGETDLEQLFSANPTAAFDPQKDHAGPLPIVAVSEQASTDSSAPGRLVVVGENKWLNNANLEVYYNRDLLSGILSYFAERNSPELNFPAKLIRPSRISPISADLMKNLLIAAFVIPEILLILLLCIIYKRRQC